MSKPAKQIFTCTKETPWTNFVNTDEFTIVHPDASEVGDQLDGWPGGDIVRYICPNCGHRWSAELPQ